MKMRVGVLRGGPSSEYESSLKSGSAVLGALPEECYEPVDIFIDQEGQWHIRGIPVAPDRALRHIDVVFNTLHGSYGEDGTVQEILDLFGIPYIGSGFETSAGIGNRAIVKQRLLKQGIKTPRWKVLHACEDLEEELIELFQMLQQPMVVKALTLENLFQPAVARSFREFQDIVHQALEQVSKVLVEEYVQGKDAACGIVEEFRGEKQYCLLPAEVMMDKKGESIYHCPADFSKKENEILALLTQQVHEILGAKHYSQSDFILSPSGVYFLKMNTSPELHEHSYISQALGSAGAKPKDLIYHLVELATGRK